MSFQLMLPHRKTYSLPESDRIVKCYTREHLINFMNASSDKRLFVFSNEKCKHCDTLLTTLLEKTDVEYAVLLLDNYNLTYNNFLFYTLQPIVKRSIWYLLFSKIPMYNVFTWNFENTKILLRYVYEKIRLRKHFNITNYYDDLDWFGIPSMFFGTLRDDKILDGYYTGGYDNLGMLVHDVEERKHDMNRVYKGTYVDKIFKTYHVLPNITHDSHGILDRDDYLEWWDRHH